MDIPILVSHPCTPFFVNIKAAHLLLGGLREFHGLQGLGTKPYAIEAAVRIDPDAPLTVYQQDAGIDIGELGQAFQLCQGGIVSLVWPWPLAVVTIGLFEASRFAMKHEY